MTTTTSDTIYSTIDAAGRLVVPKRLRDGAGLRPGLRLALRLRDGRVEIEVAPREVRTRRRGRLLVAEPVEEGEVLTAEIVEQTRKRIRDGE